MMWKGAIVFPKLKIGDTEREREREKEKEKEKERGGEREREREREREIKKISSASTFIKIYIT